MHPFDPDWGEQQVHIGYVCVTLPSSPPVCFKPGYVYVCSFECTSTPSVFYKVVPGVQMKYDDVALLPINSTF